LSLTNNSCQSHFFWPGFIFLLSPLTLLSCVFQGNTFDYFIGGWPSNPYAIGFINCVFDIESLNRTGPVSFSTTGCVYETQPTFLADCHSRTRAASRTRTASCTPIKTASPLPARTPSRTPTELTGGQIGGSVAAGVVIVFVVAVAVYLYKRRKSPIGGTN
jgi:hypothetical protein